MRENMSVRRHRSGSHRVLLAALATTLVVTACSPPSGQLADPPSSPNPSGTGSSAASSPSSSIPGQPSPGMSLVSADLVEKVNAASSVREGYLVRTSGRPTLIADTDGERQTMTIADTDESAWAAGNYTLRAYCAGTGTVEVSFSLGHTQRGSSLRCSPDLAIASLRVSTDAESTPSAVTITPSQDSRAAVAYRIDKGKL